MIKTHVSCLIVFCSVLVLTIASFPASVFANDSPPELWLPTPIGEEWHIIQGFYCGTHGDEMQLDIARVDGSSYNAPVRAAASGTVHFWTGSSGTLLLSHGNNYYTEYTHIQNPVAIDPGTPIEQGQVIGYIDGTDHLHFSSYFSTSGNYFRRQTLEIDFLDGYRFHDIDGCNQHAGKVVIASEMPIPSDVTNDHIPPQEESGSHNEQQASEQEQQATQESTSVAAQEITPTSTPTLESTPTETPITTSEPTIEVTPTPSVSSWGNTHTKTPTIVSTTPSGTETLGPSPILTPTEGIEQLSQGTTPQPTPTVNTPIATQESTATTLSPSTTPTTIPDQAETPNVIPPWKPTTIDRF